MECNDDNRIIGFNVTNFNLSGELNTTLGWPSMLNYLILRQNEFYGEFDLSSFYNLTSLEYIDIAYNNFSSFVGSFESLSHSVEKVTLWSNEFESIIFSDLFENTSIEIEDSVVCDASVFCGDNEVSSTRTVSACTGELECENSCVCNYPCDESTQEQDSFLLCNIFNNVIIDDPGDHLWWDLSAVNYCDWEGLPSTGVTIECTGTSITTWSLESVDLTGMLNASCGDSSCQFPPYLEILDLSGNHLVGAFDTSSLQDCPDLSELNLWSSLVFFFLFICSSHTFRFTLFLYLPCVVFC